VTVNDPAGQTSFESDTEMKLMSGRPTGPRLNVEALSDLGQHELRLQVGKTHADAVPGSTPELHPLEPVLTVLALIQPSRRVVSLGFVPVRGMSIDGVRANTYLAARGDVKAGDLVLLQRLAGQQ
jgi:hypothetical protein